MKEVMERQVTEHDEHRISPILLVLGGADPAGGVECLQAGNEPTAICDKLRERCIEIHAKQQVIGILIAWHVWANYWCGVPQHELEPVEEEGVHMREMARMLMRGPATWSWAPLQDVRRDFLHERQDDLRCSAQGINDGGNTVHALVTRVCSTGRLQRLDRNLSELDHARAVLQRERPFGEQAVVELRGL